jgi:microcystin degradation protein MlrC
MRFITGGIMHETHTFSTEPTTAATFPQHRGEECLVYAGTNHSLGGVIDACRELGIELVPTLFCDAFSTGTVTRDGFETLADELVERIGKALPADGVVLTLHGAMVADGYPDAEGEIVRRVRQVVGPDVPIAVTLDLHANIGQLMVDGCDVVTCYDTYPHVDASARAQEAVALLARTVHGEIRPTMALVKPPLMPAPQVQSTAQGPFKTLFDRAHAMEESREALTVTIAPGFAYADVPDAGTSFLVTTDGDKAKAERLARELAELAWSLRDQMIPRNVPPAQAVAEAIAYPEGPVMLIDVGDNIGGGTPGDGTVLLAEILKQGAQEAVMVIADKEAVDAAAAAGIGGTVTTTVGGKTDRLHGEPVPIAGRVRLISDGRFVLEGPENAGTTGEMGRTAVVRVDGVNLVLTSKKFAPGDQQQLKSVGIDPARQKIVVLKAAVRWRGGYGAIARHAILVDTPGLGSVDLSRFDFKHIRRPIFPLDPDTEWQGASGK